ncbi:MAG: discoidin domain-containing protein, partial [Planctomycetota bacterium]
TQEEIEQVMIGIPPGLASNPSPADAATDVPREVVLSWTPGEYAPPVNGHKVYLSEKFNDVNDGVGGIAADANNYDPGRLGWGTTYYWRVDEVNGAPDYTVHPGAVWSFATEPFAYAIENITVTASSSTVAKAPENTINGSGLDESGLLHGKDGDDAMWLSNIAGPQPTWIQYEFDKVYKMHELWVWNSNEFLEPMVGFGFKDVTIEYSTNGTDYTTLGTTAEFARAPGTPDYAHNTTVDFGGVEAKYVRLTANSNWGGILNQYGLSEVRFLYVPVQAREPSPDSGATDVSIGTIDEPIDVTLGFRAGREAATHDVYFSTDEQAVLEGTAAVTTVTEASHGPLSLDLGKTYYWRVDEVNEAETPATWQGKLWDFTTQEYFVVDDIESYNDLDPTDPNSNRIFLKWLDGYGVATNGSVVGYENPPFTEQTTVHGGKQSMPFFYDNSGTARNSEATLTLSSGRNWTVKGVETLVLWFKGNPAGFVEEPSGTITINAAGVDIWGTSDEFRYVWKQLSGDGEIVAQVLSVENTDPWAKAGVMIRNTLDADSANAMAYITPSGRVGWQYRAVAAGISVSTRSDTGVITTPHWVKLSRQGNIITAKHSSDGVTWEDMVETANPQEPSFKNIVMNPNVYIGLALTSHVSGVMCKAEFSDVTITGAASAQLMPQAIGADMPANDPASMYVALASSGGTPAAVYHDDPGAAQTGDWTEWNIPLTNFSNQGVVLTNVNTISIGFGDKASSQPGGTGTVYFDDIRLYPSR